MELQGIVRVLPGQATLIGRLADMMGESFMEELWTREALRALDATGADEARKLAVSRAIMRYDFETAVEHAALYTIADETACAGGYLRSELGPRPWCELEEESGLRMEREFLTPEECAALEAQFARMAPISDFSWEDGHAAEQGFSDFLHFYSLGVDARRRGSGAFRRLMEPFFAFADAQGIPCYLETYSDRLAGLYAHFGFEIVGERRDAAFEVYERCMMRPPR